MTTGKSLRRVEATGPMVARAVAMEEAVTVAAKLAWWVARAAARAAGGGGSAASTSPSDRLSTIFRPPFLLVSRVPSPMTCPCATLCRIVRLCVRLCEGVPGYSSRWTLCTQGVLRLDKFMNAEPGGVVRFRPRAGRARSACGGRAWAPRRAACRRHGRSSSPPSSTSDASSTNHGTCASSSSNCIRRSNDGRRRRSATKIEFSGT